MRKLALMCSVLSTLFASTVVAQQAPPTEEFVFLAVVERSSGPANESQLRMKAGTTATITLGNGRELVVRLTPSRADEKRVLVNVDASLGDYSHRATPTLPPFPSMSSVTEMGAAPEAVRIAVRLLK
jgi:hypothetical protein